MYKVKQFLKKPECIVLSLLLVFRVIYFYSLDYHFSPDSYDYIARDGFAWLQGTVDRYRLPVYPMLIDICKYISDTYYALLICAVQLIASLISIIVLYFATKKISSKKWICIATTFLYATLNATAGWDKTLLTESLSLSLTVFIIFGIISYIEAPKYRYVIMTTICLLVGCFLRAVFVIYAGLFFGFMVIVSIWPDKSLKAVNRLTQRLTNIKCASVAAIPVVLVLIYAFIFNYQYGGFTISDSGLGQQLYIVLENDYYEYSSDSEIKGIADAIVSLPAESFLEAKANEFFEELYNDADLNNDNIQQMKNHLLTSANKLDVQLEQSLERYIYEEYQNDYNCSFTSPEYLARLYIMENFDRSRVKEFVNEAKHNNLKSYLGSMLCRISESYSSYNSVEDTHIANPISWITDNAVSFLSLNIFHSLLIAFAEFISYITILIKKKKSVWIRLGLGIYILLTVLLSLFGTNAEFARTAITCVPFMFVALSMYAECFVNLVTVQRCDNLPKQIKR